MESPEDVALEPGTCGRAPCAGEAEAGRPGPGTRGRDAHLAPAGLWAARGHAWERGRWGWGDRVWVCWSRGRSQFLGVSRLLPRGLAFSDFPSNLARFLPLPLPASPLSPPPPPPSSSWLLQCGGCGYLVNCNCGPLPWERCFLSVFFLFFIFSEPKFSRVFSSHLKARIKVGERLLQNRMIKKTCVIHYSGRRLG